MRSLRVAAVLLVLTAAASARQTTYTQQVHVTAIELNAHVVDAQGRTPADLRPSDFVVVEDGVEHPVVSLEYLGASQPAAPAPAVVAAAPVATPRLWNIVIYVDLELSNIRTMRDALRSLTPQAERFTSLGTVEVVVADPAPRRILTSTRDTEAVRAALAQAERMPAHNRITKIRREFNERRTNDLGNATELGTSDVRGPVEEEQTVVQIHLEHLARWLGTYSRLTPNALFLVTDGFDLNPAEYYTQMLAGGGDDRSGGSRAPGVGAAVNAVVPGPTMSGSMTASTLSNDVAQRTARLHEALTQAAAAGGWTVVPLSGGIAADFTDDAETKGGRRVSKFTTGGGNVGRGGVMATGGGRDPLFSLAEATGGTVMNNPAKFAETIDSLNQRIRLTYQVSRSADATIRRVEVRSLRPGLAVRTTRWTSSSTPELTASARTMGLLERDAEKGELPTVAKIDIEGSGDVRNGMLFARLAVAPIGPFRPQLTNTTVRVSVAVEQEKQRPAVTHILLRNQDLSKREEVAFRAPIQIPKKVKRIAIAMEELTTGAWGGSIIVFEKAPRTQTAFLSEGWTESTTTEAALPPMMWGTFEEALAAAQASGRLILAYSPHVPCDRCDRYETEILGNESFRAQLADFVPVRIDAARAKAIGTNKAFAVLDPWGRPRFGWTDVEAHSLVTRMLQARDRGRQIVQAGQLLNAGKAADAHFALGFMYLQGNVFDEARREYEEARQAAVQAGDAALAQRAEVQLALALAHLGKSKDAQRSLDRITKAPANASNEAEAWLIIGHLRKGAGDANGAVDAYNRAAKKAPKGSPLEKAALTLAGM